MPTKSVDPALPLSDPLTRALHTLVAESLASGVPSRDSSRIRPPSFDISSHTMRIIGDRSPCCRGRSDSHCRSRSISGCGSGACDRPLSAFF
jgi:hypothetical protein